MLEMTKVGCCDVVTSASEMGMMEGEREIKRRRRKILDFSVLSRAIKSFYCDTADSWNRRWQTLAVCFHHIA